MRADPAPREAWARCTGDEKQFLPAGIDHRHTVYHFPTRTKTGRAEQLNAGALAPQVELAESDAAELGIYLGLISGAELVLAASRRTVADGHAAEADVHHLGHLLAGQGDSPRRSTGPSVSRQPSRPRIRVGLRQRQTGDTRSWAQLSGRRNEGSDLAR